MATTTLAKRKKQLEAVDSPRQGREWAPRFWDGMDFLGWVRLLARNRCAVDWRYAYIAVFITGSSALHTFLKCWQFIERGWFLRKAKIEHPPVFILGHWRSGTTFLHELLVRDDRHAFATTYQCFVPNHFVTSEWFATRFLKFLLPDRRPMDNMPAGWDRPQEDEWALCNLGLPSPYLTVAFPNHPPQYQEYLTLEGVPPRDLRRWKKVFHRFLRQVTYRNPRRLVLKSPTHTCRIKVLLEMFPDARFVHIVRDPRASLVSTLSLWKRLYERQSLQKPTYEGVEEYVFDNFNRMYERFEADRHLIDPARFCEIRYEDLVRDPLAQLEAIYRQLNLGDFEHARPAIEQYLDEVADYQTNRHEVPDEFRREISRRCRAFIRRYGYEADVAWKSTKPFSVPSNRRA